MGAAKARKQAFLRQHPLCCYCGGASVAVTIDHNPARSFFPAQGAPKGFIFPACEPCNQNKRRDESRLSLLAGAFNLNEPWDDAHTAQVAERVRAFAARDKEFSDSIGAGYDLHGDELPGQPIEIPRRYTDSAAMCGLWLGLALYYGSTGRICGGDQRIGVGLFSNMTPSDQRLRLQAMLGHMERYVPPTYSSLVPARFSWARALGEEWIAIMAEIAGSALWFIAVHSGKLDENQLQGLNWFYWSAGWKTDAELRYM